MGVPRKTTLSLSRDMRSLMNRLMRERPSMYPSGGELIRRSILVSAFLWDQVKAGKKIHLYDPTTGVTEELVFDDSDQARTEPLKATR